jgi:hypothetical protein
MQRIFFILEKKSFEIKYYDSKKDTIDNIIKKGGGDFMSMTSIIQQTHYITLSFVYYT